jgi:hypothetical protein
MKKILLAIGLLSSTLLGSSFFAVIYQQSLEEKVLTDNITNMGTLSLGKIKFGTQFFPIESNSRTFEGYMDLGYGATKSIEGTYNNQPEELSYKQVIINMGVSFSLNNNFVLFGGPGWSFSELRVNHKGEETESKLNFNGGVAMYLPNSHFGIIVDYDSVPKTVGAGVTYRF